MDIPSVDFSAWNCPQNESSRQTVAQELVEACKKVGFVRITNHSLPGDTLDRAFDWMKRLFKLPEEEKMKAPHPEGWAIHRGYSWPGLEKVSKVIDEESRKKSREVPDVKVRACGFPPSTSPRYLVPTSDIESCKSLSHWLKEVYDIGSENNMKQPNQWIPEDSLPGFRDFMTQFYWECDRVGSEILRALAIGLELEDEDYLTRKHSGNENQLRLLHYLPVQTEELETERVTRCGAHTDWSSITLLFQDDCGGLEVQDVLQPGTFVPVAPLKNSIVMNVGDLLQRWSNDQLRSTNHRVGLPELSDRIEGPNRITRERFSIPYFMSPDDDMLIECIPSCMSEDVPAKYMAMTRGDYNKMRASMMY